MNITVLGASGDLATRKLLPAIPKEWNLKAYGRRKMSWSTLKRKSKAVCKGTYHSVDLLTHEWDEDIPDIVYCALPSTLYVKILKRMPLGKNTIVLCEKPVGNNTRSAARIVRTLSTLPCRVQYIDHYLGKGILDSFYFLHMANPLLKNSWKPQHIESITVYMKERMTAKHRAEYYDATGVIRDVVQNHGLQLLAHSLLTTSHYTKNTGSARANIIKGFTVQTCTVAQYQPYHSNVKVPTYAEVTLSHAKWKRTTFKIVAGKGLYKKYTAVHIKMRQACPADLCPVSDTIILELYPTPRVHLQFYTGTTRMKVKTIDIPLDIALTQTKAYHNILKSIPSTKNMVSDKEIMAQWKVIEPCLKKRATKRYRIGSAL